jgi:hypothetical protein
MIDETQHENTAGHGGFERQDLQPSGILYFLLALVVMLLVCIFALVGVFDFLDHREKVLQPAVNPLLTNVPADTRHVPPGYPQSAFPNPRLEEDERGQLDGITLEQEKTLYSYGWVDEKGGAVRIPIERAMDLIVQRGLPVRSQNAGSEISASPQGSEKESIKTTASKKGARK